MRRVVALLALAALAAGCGGRAQRVVAPAARYGEPDGYEHYARAEVLASRGNLNEARRELARALAADDDLFLRVRFAELTAALGQRADALAILDALIDGGKIEDSEALIARARIRAGGPELRAARADYARAIALAGDAAQVRWIAELSALEGDLGDHEAAIKRVERDRRLMPLWVLAMVRAGRSAEAATGLAAALAKRPDDPDLLTARARLSMRMGDVELARTTVARALAKDPVHLEALTLRGELALALGNDAEAEVSLIRATTIAPHAPEPYLHLAELAQRRGEHAEADRLLRRGLSENPPRALRAAIEARLRTRFARPDPTEESHIQR